MARAGARSSPVDHLADLDPPLPHQPVVVNLRALVPGWTHSPDYVYIGRSGKGLSGPWGNPIAHGKPCRVCGGVHTEAAATLPCYRVFLADVLASPVGPQLEKNILALSGRTLVCFCHPRPCHGHDLVRVWRRLVQAREGQLRSFGRGSRHPNQDHRFL